MYFKRNGEEVLVNGIKDLKRGDEVYANAWKNGQFVKVTVARVRTVECATIVTIKKHPDIDGVRFAGYHTGDTAIGDRERILTMYTYSGERLQEAENNADKITDKIASRNEALYALKVLRSWLSGSDKKVSETWEDDDE